MSADRTASTTLLGLRFVDAGLGEVVDFGLDVRLYPRGQPARKVSARRVGSGCWAAFGVPGLREFEREEPTAQRWRQWLAAPKPYVVEVVDLERRFMPCCYLVNVPTPPAGVDAEATVRAGLPPLLPLYSAPWRKVGAHVAAVRAQLRRRSNGRPLALAWVAASVDGKLCAEGPSDDQGQVLLLFRHPFLPAAPPPASVALLRDLRWPLLLQVRQSELAVAPPGAGLDVVELRKQSTGNALTLLADVQANQPDVPLQAVPLRAGRELMLSTRVDGQPGSSLLVA